MVATLIIAALAGAVLSLTASMAMTRSSRLSPAWNIAIGGVVALAIGLVLYLLVVLIERAAFG